MLGSGSLPQAESAVKLKSGRPTGAGLHSARATFAESWGTSYGDSWPVGETYHESQGNGPSHSMRKLEEQQGLASWIG